MGSFSGVTPTRGKFHYPTNPFHEPFCLLSSLPRIPVFSRIKASTSEAFFAPLSPISGRAMWFRGEHNHPTVGEVSPSTEKTLDRKIKEALLSVQIEAKYSKEEIILLYLNSIYLGNGANGIQAAALHYFHRPVWELSLGEMTLLAGLPQAPSRYDPTRHPERARKRRATVLNRMVARGYISRTQADEAESEPIRVFRRQSLRHSVAPYCAEAARKQLAKTYGKNWYTQGWTVHTSCDVARSRQAQEALQAGLEHLDRRQGWRGPPCGAPRPKRPRPFGKREENSNHRSIQRLLTWSLFQTTGRRSNWGKDRRGSLLLTSTGGLSNTRNFRF